MKRLFDILISVTALLLAAPVLIILLVMIRLESAGNPLFIQKRLGRHKQIFSCFKLRTMYKTAPEVSAHTLPPNYITKLGRFLRKSKLDELPQLVNVLRGEMSLVGPRPGLPSQDTLIAERERLGVFEVRPGITGLAQIQGVGTTDALQQAFLDSEYIAAASFMQDLKILMVTACGRWKPANE